MSESQKVIASLIGALLVHFAAFSMLAFLQFLLSDDEENWVGRQSKESVSRLHEVTVTGDWLMAVAKLEAGPHPAALTYIDTSRNTASSAAPENARYESDRNTLAQSQLTSLSLDARRDQPTLAEGNPLIQTSLVNQRFTQGEHDDAMKSSPRGDPAVTQAKQAIVNTENASETQSHYLGSTGVFTSDSASRDGEAKADDRESAEAKRDPAETTPDLPNSMSDGDKSQAQFQPESLQSSLDGSADRMGEAAVDSISTPVGIYKKKVQEVISEKWHHYRQENAEAVTWGILKVEFIVDPSGRISDLEITKNEANQMLEEFSLRAIRDAQLPPMPAEVSARVGGKGLLVQYDIIIY